MSNKLRNPFKMRASERIESDVNFLRLFSPAVLNVLIDEQKEEELWGNVLFIRSSAGAGKTSLLRIFEPNLLSLVHNHKGNPDYRETFSKLKTLGVLDNKEVLALGVLIKCTRNYELLEEIDVGALHKKRLFYALLNSRIILSTLQRISELKGLNFPEDLDQITFDYEDLNNHFKKIQFPCNGKTLFDWGSNLEIEIYEILDSFVTVDYNAIEGHDELFSVYALAPQHLIVDGEKIAEKIIFMIDDAHKLSDNQRKSLFEYIAEQRQDCSIWISERLVKIENFSSFLNRDYNEINLESFWSKNTKEFNKALLQISLSRASYSNEGLTSFREYLSEFLTASSYKAKLSVAIEKSLAELVEVSSFTSKFDEWKRYLVVDSKDEITHDRAFLIRKAILLIHRDKSKNQLDFNFPLSKEQLFEGNNELTSVGKLFLNRYDKIPYYYSFANLSKIASNNIEQFLSFASEIFEGILSNSISGKNPSLSADRQEKIIRKVASQKWDELDILLPNSIDVKNFIHNLGLFLQSVTFSPTASYAPGITGFAILQKPGLQLISHDDWMVDDVYSPLREVLRVCLAYNLFEHQKITQGAKGQQWDVYYLNRWLCVKYNLPLQYGGWNKIKPKELYKWIKK
jgi:hypothetical protein